MADLTQHPPEEGWLYLSTVLDAFSRRVVGWAIGERPTAALVIDALNRAVWNRRPDTGLVHHSDHGTQYTSWAFSRRLEAAGLLGSMGSVGDALDNAAAESVFATLQAELLDRRSWPTRQALQTAIFEYIEAFYNRRRRHSALGYLSPTSLRGGGACTTKGPLRLPSYRLSTNPDQLQKRHTGALLKFYPSMLSGHGHRVMLHGRPCLSDPGLRRR